MSKIFFDAISKSQESPFVKDKSEIRSEIITVTKCLSSECTGFYIDTISESILVKCLDPKHNNQKQSAGQATNPRPAADGASFNPTVDLHGKEEEHTEQ